MLNWEEKCGVEIMKRRRNRRAREKERELQEYRGESRAVEMEALRSISTLLVISCYTND